MTLTLLDIRITGVSYTFKTWVHTEVSATRDCDIRLALEARLVQQHGDEPDTIIRHEVGICAGKRRIDMAVVNGELTGYEIKSDMDTLARLVGQANAYGSVLDRVVLVTTERHVDSALPLLPDWWGRYCG